MQLTMVSRTSEQPKPKSRRKPPSKKVLEGQILSDKSVWTVHHGVLEPTLQANADDENRLFQVVGEKLPYSSLSAVKNHMRSRRLSRQGVYVAHDSMGCSRYVGRGNIFSRLEARKKAQPLVLEYYSFYVVRNKNHEREVETLLIRAAGFLLEFNDRKKRVGLAPGNIRDYESGTVFYERHGTQKPAKKIIKKRAAIGKEA